MGCRVILHLLRDGWRRPGGLEGVGLSKGKLLEEICGDIASTVLQIMIYYYCLYKTESNGL